MRRPTWLLLLSLLIASPAAAARRWSLAEVTASSVKKAHLPWRAIDNETRTHWCEGAAGNGVGEALTITFAAPTALDGLEIMGRGTSPPTSVDIAIDDGGPHRVDLIHGLASHRIAATARKLRVTIAAARGHRGDACLDLGLGRVSVFLGDAGAFRALPAVVDELFRGVATCDAGALAAIGAFPLRLRRFKSAQHLADACRKKMLSKLQPEGWPDGNCALTSPNAVDCIGVGPDSRWYLEWTKQGWKLVALREHHYPE